MSHFEAFIQAESEVRNYCRDFPAVFSHAKDHIVSDERGNQYIDFLSGAGTMVYGHNNTTIQQALIDYLSSDCIVHSLDMYTAAKREFIENFSSVILEPRGLEYRLQFTGPTGTNAVEAAIKLACKVTGRSSIAAFTNGFHGVTLGALAATGSRYHRGNDTYRLNHVSRLPYDGYFGKGLDTIDYIEKLLNDPSSGVDIPAAFLVETIQGEGGLNVASPTWLRRLKRVAEAHSILLIVDDIQAGCGRGGGFFSFERAEIVPDLVCLSKGLSGYGLPLAIVLIKPQHDQWRPGEHNGTFRGHNLAFVTASVALDFWRQPRFERSIQKKSAMLHDHLSLITSNLSENVCEICGYGMMQGLRFVSSELATLASRYAFEEKVLTETCGSRGEVLKLLPALTISDDALEEGLIRVQRAVEKAVCHSVGINSVTSSIAEAAVIQK